jgi:hypothetical protein
MKMLGLIFAALYVAYSVVVQDSTPLVAFESTLGFLWYWHIVWGSVLILIGLLVPLGGLVMTAAGGDKKTKAAGLAVLAGSPIVFLLLLFVPGLFLGGVYCLDSGIQGGEVVNQNHVIVGGILYGLGILLRLASRGSSKSN